MNAARIDTPTSAIVLATALLLALGSMSFGADPLGVPPPGGKQDDKGADWKNNPFCVQYVRVWRVEPQ